MFFTRVENKKAFKTAAEKLVNKIDPEEALQRKTSKKMPVL